MACYSVWSRPVIRRSGPVRFTVAAMAVGVLALLPLASLGGSSAPAAQFGMPHWLEIGYLGVFGGAIGLFLSADALGRTSPTLVAVSVTVNPVTAGLVGAWILDEPLRWNLVRGLVAVLAGIAVASTARERA